MARKGGKQQAGEKAGEGFKEIVAEVTEQLVSQARKDVEREKWITPHKFAQKYGIKISIAKKVLKTLEDEGVIVLFNKNRRAPLYIPKKKAPLSPPAGL
ncbi:MAG: 30S ribosomal protein S25e [Aeropyrum sp.]|nr:30S ribosomal protein S25e [Aeropyrum sp.]MCE4616615.1 30S ribosomal protein S25e [Aeropyrum sp.]